MAVRLEELGAPPTARIYRFPTPEVAPEPRLTPFGRVALGVATVVVAGMLLFAGGPSSVSSASVSGAPAHVVVQPGETLWDVAGRYAPRGVDPRAYVDSVIALNHLDGMPQAGMRLRLPR